MDKLWEGKVAVRKGLLAGVHYAVIYNDRIIIKKNEQEPEEQGQVINKSTVTGYQLPKTDMWTLFVKGVQGMVIEYTNGEKNESLNFYPSGWGAYADTKRMSDFNTAVFAFLGKDLTEELKQQLKTDNPLWILVVLVFSYFFIGLLPGLLGTLAIAGGYAFTRSKVNLDETAKRVIGILIGVIGYGLAFMLSIVLAVALHS